MEIGKVS